MDPKKNLKRKYLEEEESSMSNKHKLEENLSDSDDPSGGSPKRKMFGHQSSFELANEFLGFGANSNRKMDPKSEPTINTNTSASGSSYAAKMMVLYKIVTFVNQKSFINIIMNKEENGL